MTLNKDIQHYRNLLDKLSKLEDGTDEQKNLWKEFTEKIIEKHEEIKRENDRKALKDFAIQEYDGCCNLYKKIENEGLGYFYNNYTTVPCSWSIYASYCDGHDGECWCDGCEDCDCIKEKSCFFCKKSVFTNEDGIYECKNDEEKEIYICSKKCLDENDSTVCGYCEYLIKKENMIIVDEDDEKCKKCSSNN
jgi:hypothetical protein